MTCVGHYENKSPMYEKFINDNKCIRTNGVLGNKLMFSSLCGKFLHYIYKTYVFHVINILYYT